MPAARTGPSATAAARGVSEDRRQRIAPELLQRRRRRRPAERPARGTDVDALAAAPDAREGHRPGDAVDERERERLRGAASRAVVDPERVVEAVADGQRRKRADHGFDAL